MGMDWHLLGFLEEDLQGVCFLFHQWLGHHNLHHHQNLLEFLMVQHVFHLHHLLML
jgi:hypothetical protein